MANAEPLFIWLHGLGQNARKWKEVADWPGVRAVAPRVLFLQAPASPVTAFDGRSVPTWLDMPCVPLTPEAVARDMAHDPRLAASINMEHPLRRFFSAVFLKVALSLCWPHMDGRGKPGLRAPCASVGGSLRRAEEEKEEMEKEEVALGTLRVYYARRAEMSCRPQVVSNYRRGLL